MPPSLPLGRRCCNLVGGADRNELVPMELNEYYRDASMLLRAALRQRHTANDTSAIVATMLYALGVERILKGVLHDVNPVYVYKDPAFKHTVTALYAQRIIGSGKTSPEVAKQPNHDVLTFREALHRSAVISPTVQSNLATLHRIAAARDVIAHCRLSQLPPGDAMRIALLDAPHVVGAFELELGLASGALDGRLEDDPAEVAAKQQAIANLRSRLDAHARRWEALRNDPGHFSQAAKRLEVLKAIGGRDAFYVDYTCPSCGNIAALQAEVDYDYADGDSIPQGVFPVHLECTFCDLVVEDSYELDELKASDFLYERELSFRR